MLGLLGRRAAFETATRLGQALEQLLSTLEGNGEGRVLKVVFGLNHRILRGAPVALGGIVGPGPAEHPAPSGLKIAEERSLAVNAHMDLQFRELGRGPRAIHAQRATEQADDARLRRLHGRVAIYEAGAIAPALERSLQAEQEASH